MGIVEHISVWATAFMSSLGYPGLLLLMAMESMVFPVPSEAVLPFAGFLIVQGSFSWTGAILASSAGTLIGSWLSYAIGRWGGYPLVLRFGKYFLLDKDHLDFTVRWFGKRGELTIFVSRFIPVVRHLISIPAGVGRMNPWKFTLYTLLGGTLWNTFLLWCGVWLKERWEIVRSYTHEIDIGVLIVLVAVGTWWIWRQLRKRRLRKIAAAATPPQGQ
jgi:membrane protein DedA with SNARE-associated domain